MQKTDWLLLVLAVAAPPGLTPVQLQKSLFLIERRFRDRFPDSLYTFVPYNYGPFSVDIYSDAERLESAGLTVISRSGRFPIYAVTQSGAEYAAKVFKEELSGQVRDVVSRTQGMSFTSLVREIYENYPEFKKNSVFNG